ncbi:MAG: hypothetical protein D6788_09395, partial [Planctomycetota bacterium]
ILLRLAWTRLPAGGTDVDGTIDLLWNLPTNWATTDPRTITFDNGTGDTFGPNTFAEGDLVGFRYSRQGADPFDSSSDSIVLYERLTFEYTAKAI